MKRLALMLALLCSSHSGPTDDGCTVDGPALTPAASHETETTRARLGATDNGRDIVL